MKGRKTYEKPAVIFEKSLEALAQACDPTGDKIWKGSEPGSCKAVVGDCTFLFS